MAQQTEPSTPPEGAVVESSKKWIAVLGVLTATLTLTTAALGVVGTRATQQKDVAEDQVSSLSDEVSTLTTEVESIRSERESLLAEVDDLEQQRDELRQELESVTQPDDPDGPDGPPSEAAVTGLTYLSNEDRLARDQYGFGSEQVSGTVYPNSVFGYQSYCGGSARESSADWDLGRRHETFTATAGLSDKNHSATLTVRFEVFADNEQVYQETIGVGEAVPVSIPVEGKLRIRLLTVFLTPEDCSSSDRAVWGDAAVS